MGLNGREDHLAHSAKFMVLSHSLLSLIAIRFKSTRQQALHQPNYESWLSNSLKSIFTPGPIVDETVTPRR